MTKIKKTFFILGLIFSCMLILAGTLIFFINPSIKGLFFRKTYGYISCTKSQEILLSFLLFNVGNENISFLESKNDISFDNQNVVINKVKATSVSRVRDIEVIQYDISLRMKVYDKLKLTKLLCTKNGDLFASYEIGCIDLENFNYASEQVNHGADSNFTKDKEYYLSIIRSNAEPFVVTDLIFSNEKIETANEFIHRKYTVGSDLGIVIKIDFNIDYFDIFVLKPMVVFIKENEDTESYFTTLILTRYDIPMTYIDIKDYIKNA